MFSTPWQLGTHLSSGRGRRCSGSPGGAVGLPLAVQRPEPHVGQKDQGRQDQRHPLQKPLLLPPHRGRSAPPRPAGPAAPPPAPRVRPSARRRQQLYEEKRPRRRPRSNSAALPPLAGRGAGLRHRVTAGGWGCSAVTAAREPRRAACPVSASSVSAAESREPWAAASRCSFRSARVRQAQAARSPPLGPRWCGPLLGGSPARRSFAKVPELASWALTGARCGTRSWGPPKSRPATSAPDSSREFSGSPGDMQIVLESGHSTSGSRAVASHPEARPGGPAYLLCPPASVFPGGKWGRRCSARARFCAPWFSSPRVPGGRCERHL